MTWRRGQAGGGSSLGAGWEAFSDKASVESAFTSGSGQADKQPWPQIGQAKARDARGTRAGGWENWTKLQL